MTLIKHKSTETGIYLFSIISTAIILLLGIMLGRLGLLQAISIFSLSSILINLPVFIRTMAPQSKGWWVEDAPLMIVSILFLPLLGLLTKSMIATGGIVILGTLLVFWQISRIRQIGQPYQWLFGFFLIGVIIPVFYTQGYHSLLFIQKILLGEAHVDTLFHMSIAKMIDSTFVPTTGLHGTPLIKYHWFSHFLLSGLANISQCSAVEMYNIGYPAIFIPLTIKVAYQTTNLYTTNNFGTPIKPEVFFTVLTLAYAFIDSVFLNTAAPFKGESYTISIILAYSFCSSLIYYTQNSQYRGVFLAYSVLTIILICLTKISTGVVLFGGVFCVAFFKSPSIRNFLRLSALSLLVAVFVYFVIFPNYRAAADVSVITRINNLLKVSKGGFLYCSGLILILMTSFKGEHGRFHWPTWIKSLQHRHYLFFIVLSLTGIAGALYASGDGTDVFYFGSTQFYFSAVFILILINHALKQLGLSARSKTIMLFAFSVFGFLSHFATIKSFIKEYITISTTEIHEDAQHLSKLLSFLKEVDFMNNKSEIAIYVPQTEGWLHNSQTYRSLSSNFVIPAMSGIAQIRSFSDSLYHSVDDYSLYYYKKEGNNYLSVNSDETAKMSAKQLGYKKLYIIRKDGDGLTTNLYNL